MISRLVRIVDSLLEIGSVEGIRGPDGVVIAKNAMSTQDGFQQRLSIHSILEREPDVVVIKGRRVGTHRERVVERSGRLFDKYARLLVEQRRRLDVDTVNHIHLTRYKERWCERSGRLS